MQFLFQIIVTLDYPETYMHLVKDFFYQNFRYLNTV